MNEPPVLELTGIRKSFGPVQALRGAAFVLSAGEVHALLGENGAGKSTLLQIAFGLLAPDAGTVRLGGREVRLRSPREAREAGIGMVHQHFTTIGSLTVAENLALDRGRSVPAESPPGDGLMEGLELSALVAQLSVELRQRLEIAKALARRPRILLLDEPSAALAPSEIEELLTLARSFAQAGGAVAFVTHKLAEVFAVANRVTVLRDGAVTLTAPLAGQTLESLARAMLGEAEGWVHAQEPMDAVPGKPTAQAPIVVRIGSIAIRSGECVGVAAVQGNGQRELLRSIAGIGTPGQSAGIAVDGPVSFVPEDRTLEGLIPDFSVVENLVLGLDRDPRWARGSRIDWPAARRHAARVIAEFDIVASGPEVPVAKLSGGNQQKLVLARALEAAPRVLVAENPTRGLDFRATHFMQERLRAAARAGAAVLVYSSDLDEVLQLATRVLVVHQGAVREAPSGADRQTIGRLMLGAA